MKRTRFTRLTAAAVISTLTAAGVGVLALSSPASATNPSGNYGTTTYPSGTATQFDGQNVTVTFPAGSFDANAGIQIEECQGQIGQPSEPTDTTACFGTSLKSGQHAAADGSFSGTYPGRLLGISGYPFASASGLHIDDSGTHPGVMFVGESATDLTQKWGLAPLAIGLYGRLVPQTVGTAMAGGPAVTLDASTGAPALDSAGNALTISGYATTAPAPTQGTVGAPTGSVFSYVPQTAAFTLTTDTFGVSATGSDPSNPSVNIPSVTETVNLGHGNAPTVSPTVTSPLPNQTAGSTATVAPNAAGTDSTGAAETIVSVTPSSPTSGNYGTVACTQPSGPCTYTLGGAGTIAPPAGGATDTFTITAVAKTAGSNGGPTYSTTSGPVSISIPPSFTPNCDATSGTPACPLNQLIDIPVTAGDLTMAQNGGLPVDTLGNTLQGNNCTGPAITLNGEPQWACGVMAPITVINARGTDAGWDLTGQVTDFIDSGRVTTSSLTPIGASPVGTLNSQCDTVLTYNNHCIPGGNLGWVPAAAVAQAIVPGDVAEVLGGTGINAPGKQIIPTQPTAGFVGASPTGASSFVNPLGGTCGVYSAPADAISDATPAALHTGQCTDQATINYPTGEPAPNGGLHNAAQTLCSSSEPTANSPFGGSQAMPAGHAGGTFECGADLIVAVPASAAAPTGTGGYGGVGYQAFLTLTLA